MELSNDIIYSINPIRRKNNIIGHSYEVKLKSHSKSKFKIQTYKYNNGSEYANMSIVVNKNQRGKGYARKLIKEFFKIFQFKNIKPFNILYVNMNASNGFWNTIGMTKSANPIFEKQISLKNLQKWANYSVNIQKCKRLKK